MSNTALFLTVVLSLAATPALAAEPPPQIAGIETAIQGQIDAHHAAGVVTLVMQDGKLIHHAAAGFADRERQVPMSNDSVFWIASMTKSISVATIMTLVDEGRLSLDEPASNWLPELGQVKLADGNPPSRPITLRDLMSHTSGVAFPPRRASDGAHSLKSYTAELVRAPLAFDPGSNYEYGFGITVAGRIAEIVSATPFETLVHERILAPLEMHDTSFHPDERLRARIARTYKTADDGPGLALTYNTFVTSDVGVRRMVEPSGGLFSTAADMAKFYQMVLDRGLHQGRRLLSEASITEMTTPHVAGGKTLNYGLGWQCNQPQKLAIPGFSSVAFGHGGAFGTHGWIDPQTRVVAVLMVQNVLVNDGGELRKAFHEQVSRAFPQRSE